MERKGMGGGRVGGSVCGGLGKSDSGGGRGRKRIEFHC